MSATFKTVDRKTPYILPPSMDDWLPRDHPARFIVGAVPTLDLEPIRAAYAGRGSEAYDPSVLLSLLFYGYATRSLSSRRIEAATYDSVAFRYIAGAAIPTMTPSPPSGSALSAKPMLSSYRSFRSPTRWDPARSGPSAGTGRR
ncbi:MAG TPA: hypothetical protein DIV80_00365 [Synergistaceae bacterium]|nr:hypothetical protein [Synergistaceae bacterium]